MTCLSSLFHSPILSFPLPFIVLPFLYSFFVTLDLEATRNPQGPSGGREADTEAPESKFPIQDEDDAKFADFEN